MLKATAAWLLVIIFDIIIMFKVLKLLLEVAERYVILAVLSITAPLAFSMGGSKSTSEIFTGWCRMFGSMCLLMVTNVMFFKMLLSVVSTVPSGLDVFPWMVLIITIVKVAKKADEIITRIGLNPAITGDRGKGFGRVLAYTMLRSATSKDKDRGCGGNGRGQRRRRSRRRSRRRRSESRGWRSWSGGDSRGLRRGWRCWRGLPGRQTGHIGVYIGNGYVVEAMGTKYGVVRTKVEGRGWRGWCKVPSIDYIEE